MIIEVSPIRGQQHLGPRYIEVRHMADNGADRDTARRIAYQFVHRNPQADYNLIANSTRILEVEIVSADASEILRNLR